MAKVSSGRTTGGVRAARTRATRQRMLTAARELFVERGYPSTRIEDIAQRAGVAVQTVYFTFGNKRALLTELLDVSIAGDDEPVPTMERPWFTAAIATPDPAEQIRQQVAAATTIHERTAAVLTVIRAAAAADADIARLWRTNTTQRHAVQSRLAEALAAKTALRRGISAAQAADIAHTLLSPECYHTLVAEQGWTSARWREWATDALIRQLLPDA